MRHRSRISIAVPEVVLFVRLRRTQHEGWRGFRRLARGQAMVVLQAPLVAAHPHLDLAERRVEGGMGVAAAARGVQLLPCGQADHKVDAKGVSILADHHFGADAAALEVLLDA